MFAKVIIQNCVVVLLLTKNMHVYPEPKTSKTGVKYYWSHLVEIFINK